MPMYEYKCGSCGAVFELIQKFSDEPLKTHAECGGPVERLISASAFQFKGSGWYVTDYARKSGNGGKSESSASESKSEAKDSKGDSKGESKKTESAPVKTDSSTPAPAKTDKSS